MLSGDIGNRLFDKFKDAHPDRFFNCGVAEQNMMGVAAGLGMSGLRPVVYTITPFVTTRCLEQIRTDVCYHEAARDDRRCRRGPCLRGPWARRIMPARTSRSCARSRTCRRLPGRRLGGARGAARGRR